MNVTVAVWVTVTLSVVSVAVYVIDSAVVSLASKVISPLPFVVVICGTRLESSKERRARGRWVRRAGDDSGDGHRLPGERVSELILDRHRDARPP